jgi:hypothetical protein
MNERDILIVNNTGVDTSMFDSVFHKAALTGKLPEELADLFTLEILDGEFTINGQTFLRRGILNFA